MGGMQMWALCACEFVVLTSRRIFCIRRHSGGKAIVQEWLKRQHAVLTF